MSTVPLCMTVLIQWEAEHPHTPTPSHTLTHTHTHTHTHTQTHTHTAPHTLIHSHTHTHTEYTHCLRLLGGHWQVPIWWIIPEISALLPVRLIQYMKATLSLLGNTIG